MKKLHTLLTSLFIAAFMAASFGLQAETITSTQNGNWNVGDTWVGGNVPTSADSVVVNHLVNIINGDSCMHLYVAPSGTIQNLINSSRTLVVDGNLWVDGTATNTNNFFNIKLAGNIHLNGTWSNPGVYFIGTSEQIVSASPGKVFNATINNILFTDDDPTSPVKFATDLTFIDIELVGNATTVEFAPGIEVAFYGEPIRNANIIGNNASLLMSGTAFIEDSNLDNLTLKGLVNMGDDNTSSGELIVADTLQNLINGTRTLEVFGNFTNLGVIKNSNNYLNLKIHGNLTNNGEWTDCKVHFVGSSEQTVSAAPGKVFEATISGVDFVDEDPLSPLKFATDLTFIDIRLLMNNTTIEFAPGIEVALIEEEIDKASIIGNNSSLRMGNGSYMQDCTIENLTFKGTVNIGSGNTASGDIINADTLQNQINGTRTLEVFGNFTNLGVIKNTNNYLNIKIHGNLTNNGKWTDGNVYFDGTTDHSLHFAPGTFIDCFEFKNLNPAAKLILQSDIEIHGGFVRPNEGVIEANNHLITLRENAYMDAGTIINPQLGGQFKVNSGVVFSGTTYVVDSLTIRNTYSHQLITVEGDLINNGFISRNPFSINNGLQIDLTGNLQNNGLFDAEHLRFTGMQEQYINSSQKGTEMTVEILQDTDSAQGIRLDTDLTLVNCEILLEESTLQLNNVNLFMIGGDIREGYLTSQQNFLHQSQDAYIYKMHISETHLKGDCHIYHNDTYFENVTVDDTLRNRDVSGGILATTSGDFVNNGVITSHNTYRIDFHVEGNFYNHGDALLGEINFTGSGIQEFSSATGTIQDADIANAKTDAYVLAVDDLHFENCNLYFSDKELHLQNAGIYADSGMIQDVTILGNGNTLEMGNSAYAFDVYFDDLTLTNNVGMRGTSNTFKNVTINDTLSRGGNYNHDIYITVKGTLQNNGFIDSYHDSYDFVFFVEDTIINNGIFMAEKIQFSGSETHYIESQNNHVFELEQLFNLANGGPVVVISDLLLLNAEVVFNGYELILPENGLLQLDNTEMDDVLINAAENAVVTGLNESVIKYSIISGALLFGDFDLGENNTFNNCVLDAALMNDDLSSDTELALEGLTEHNNIIQNRPSWSYELYLNFFGHLMHNGVIECEEARWRGTDDQDIYLLNGNEINTPCEFDAMIASSPFQWYKNDVLIDGETDDQYNLPMIGSADRGYYHCETGQGPSRTIRVCTPVEIDLAAEAWFCQTESVMLEPEITFGEPPYTWSWSPAEGLSDANIQNPLANPENPTLYTLTVTDAIGCRGESNIYVQQYPQLHASAGNDKQICYGFSSMLNGSAWGGEPDYSYEWSPTTGLNNPNIATPIANPTSTTFYTLTVTDANGCVETSNASVTVNTLPEAYAFSQDSTHFCSGTTNIICQMLGSETGVDYHVLINGSPNGEIIPGTGDPMDIWATTTIQGHYTVRGENTSTGCQKMMIGSVMVYMDFSPVVLDQSGDELLIEGTDITLWVDVTSTQPPEFKWYKNDIEIPGAPNYQYLLESVTLSDTGMYYCVVTNNCDVIQSEPVIITVLSQQTAEVPAGWSGISTYLSLWDDAVDKIFQYVQGDLVVVNDFEHMYWPGQNINTYQDGLWDTYTGAQIKMSAAATVDFQGLHLDDFTVELNEAWTYMPVLHQTPVPADELFMQAPDQVIIAKDIAGTGVYWPEHGINTLDMLNPGLAFLVKVSEATEVDFGIFVKSNRIPSNARQPENTSPWNDPVYSNRSHTIALPKEVAISALMPGDWIGVFNSDGTCCGIIEFDGNSTAITAFGNDQTTNEVDGLLESEWMTFKAYRPSTNETFELTVQYDASANESGYFAVNGMSVISGLKAGETGTGDVGHTQIRVYPNPTTGIIFLDGISIDSQVEITNAAGQVVYQSDATGKNSIDLSSHSKGLYSIRVTNQKYTIIRKVVVE
jgi:hypothetical protein